MFSKTQTMTKNKIIKIFQTSPLSPLAKEIWLFAGIFLSVFVISVWFVNANLIYHTVRDIFQPAQAAEFTFTSDNISTLLSNNNELNSYLNDNKGKEMLTSLKKNHTLFVNAAQKTKTQLQNKEYEFTYSLTPPGNRLYIPAIWVDAPIVDISFASEEKLKKWDFETELYDGVVKYPSTPEPWSRWNSLIFGHTSYYRWKKNPYGEVFAKIYDLKIWDEIKVSRKWQLYTYEIVESVVVKPGEVDTKYLEYTDGEYITLMGCYPVWSDARRGLIIAKRKSEQKTITSNFAYSR